MKEFLKKNKIIIIILAIILVLFTYCGLQTFVASDDLPYSFFYRGESRVTTLKQIYLNQRSDYYEINGRFLVHSMVQFLLMYGKKLFSLLNAICIAITIFVMWKIVCFKSKESKIKKNYILILLTGLFLFLGEHKYLMYWVAGSVNYIWVFTLLIIYSYYYLKVGLNKHKIINCLILFLLSALHECAFVFLLFLIISDLIKDIIESDF